jgi:uncharacterized phage-associated protein
MWGDDMLTAKEVAEYFLSKDPERKIFNSNIVFYNGRKSYEGNIKLNKYLFLAQVVHLAKYECKLFNDSFLAYDNGPVIESIMNSYKKLSGNNGNLNAKQKDFLDKIYLSLENASYEELIEITHEDPEWQNLSDKTFNAPIMELEKNINEYKKRYKGLIEALKI